ncbi:DUF6531 domain-containing protein [Thomasclavelia cocleata]|uniref:DUF6531 domain-containing protein n=4 Tax=Thomasclavelia cocleata TaxID=69824 RepID=UPI00241E0585|nr:DUF6531 domain-containing protein [Thomasclavelia cocleata]
MHFISKHIKKILLIAVVSAMMIAQIELFGSVYAQELEKISDKNPYGALYNTDVNNVKNDDAVIMESGDPDVITKEPVVDTKDTSRVNDQELENLRTENTKTYKLGNGEYVTEFYFDQVHKKEKGKYVEIDNSIEKKTSLFRSAPSYVNKDGLYDFSMRSGILDIEDSEGNTLTIIPSGKLENYAVKENVILYSEIIKNLDLEYRVNSSSIQQNVYINGELETNNYSFEIEKGKYSVEKNDAGDIIFSIDQKDIYTLNAPYLIDKDGSRNQEISYDYKETDSNTIVVTMIFPESWLNDKTRVYPVMAKANVEVGNVDIVDLNSSYIRSGRPDIQSQYSDLFVGYDDNFYGGQGSNIKIARTFIYFDMPNIGENQRIENAVLKLYKEQDLDYANELNDINVYNSNYVNPSTVTWNNQPTSKQLISNNKFSKPKGFKDFDITKHVQELQKGQKKTLILQVTDESSKWNANVFNSESTGNLPKVEIYHCDDFDVDPNLDINQFDNELRVYAKDGQYFEAISMDGIAKPNSDINFNLYAKVNNTDFEKVKTQKAKDKSSPYFVDPIYATNPIEGTQKYAKGEVNYTTNYLRIGEIPKYDTFYEYRMKVVNNGKTSEKELITDGFIIYKVKLGDSLKSIASHYGLKIEDIKKDNNTSTNKIKEGDVLFLRFAKDNPKVPKDVYRPPIKLSSFEAKYVYRGPACFGSCSVADPVNTSIGNFYHESDDFTLTDYDELSLKRVYNSYGDDNASIFGTNFSSNFEQYIAYDKNDNMLFFRGDGKILKIDKKDGKYSPRLVDKIKLTMDEDKVSIYDRRTELTYKFDEYGTLTSIVTKTGFESKINYDKFGWIESVTLGNKRVTFEYNDYHLVSKINLPNNTSVSYKYNDDRQLVEFTDAGGKTEKYTYDDNGKIKNITDRNGNVLANNTYDKNGTMLSQIDANGNKVEFNYEGNTTSITYAGKETETYTLDNDYKVTKIERADGSSKSYAYNDAGRMVSETDEKGRKTIYDYDSEGNLLKQTNPDGTYEKYTYDAQGNITSKTSADGEVETYKFDSNNNVIYKDTGDVQGTTYEYNSQNLVTKETNALGVWKKYEYEGHLIKRITHSNGLVETFTYDSMGNVLTESDSNGRKTTYVYDNLNRIIKKTDSYGKSESFKYDGNGNIIEYIDKLGGKTVSTYDKNNNLIGTSKGTLKTAKAYDNHNRIISETDEQGLTVKYAYDAKGQKISETDVYGNKTIYEYDEVGHNIKTTDGKGNITINEYVGDNLVKSIDGRGNITTYEYDSYNRIIKITLPSGKTQTTEYDSKGNIIKTVDERGLVNTKEYDEYDRVVKEVNEQGIVIVNTYDVYNQLIKKTEDKKTTNYVYDVYGNLISETNTYGATKRSEYDKLDRIVKETDELGYETVHKYDAADHEIETIDANGYSEKKIYDVNSILVQEIDKLGYITTYKYNSLGYQIETIDAYKNITKFEYDKYGNITKTYINDTLIESNTYDEYGRKVKTDSIKEVILNEYDQSDLIVKTTNETTGLITTNEYDQLGNLVKTSDNGGKIETKKYDQFNQVIEVTDAYGRTSQTEYDKHGQVVKEISATNEVTTNTYDKYGNVIKITTPLGSSIVSTYDLLNRKLTDVTDGKKTLTYAYDAKGQLLSTHDSFTNKTDLLKYDGMGQVIEATDKLGNVTKNTYDAKGQIIKVTDALGHSKTTEYDIYGNVIKETDALGHSKQTKYNALGLVVQEVDERGFSTSYKYNDKFQPVEVTDKLGKTAKFTYNAQGYIAKATNQNGFITTYEYDLYGQTVKETDPNGNTKTNEYDLLGNVVKSTEPNREAVNDYDDLGRLVSTKRNNKTTVTNEYNELNQIVKSTNALGYATEYEYDIYGNTIKETFVDHVTVNEYDINSQLIKKIENTDKITLYEYDALGRERKQRVNDRDMLVKKYDAIGNVIEKTEKGVTLQYVYDAKGQVIEHKYPELNNGSQFKTIVSVKYDETGNQIEFKDIYDNVLKRSYDANNNVISETNTRGYTTRYEYDSLSNMTKVQSPLERVVKYEYDGNNNMIKRIFNDKEALYTYDANNNLINEISEYGLKELYEYDADGNMTSLTKNDGTEIKYTYDALGRKLSEGSRTFEYDSYDNITKASYNNKSIEYTYDKFNNVTRVVDANDNVVEYQWDIYGNRTELKYKDNVIHYTYNQFDKIDKVLKNSQNYATYTYDARGNTASVERNGITTNYEYDELNRRTDYVNSKDDKVISTYTYEYDGENNIISETINGAKNTYTYNESDELKTSSKTIDGKVINTTYEYDLFGNKIELSSDGKNKVYRYNDKNQLTSIKSQEGLTDIYYDKNGNIRDIYYAGGYKEYYQYDEFDQLITLKTNKDRLWNYEYDGEGDRIGEKKVIENRFALDYESDSKEWYDYIQTLPFDEVQQLLKEKDSNESFESMKYQLAYKKKTGLCVSNLVKDADKNKENCTETDYVLDKTVEDALILSNGHDLNIYGEERIATESEDERLTYIGTLNQSVMQTVKDDLKKTDSKQTLSSLEYDDAGNTVDIKSGFGYNGERLDETGNIYLRARYYNPRIGQFVQIDSNRGNKEEIKTQSRYTYVANNQYKYVDPNGESIFDIIKAITTNILKTVTTSIRKQIEQVAKSGGIMAIPATLALKVLDMAKETVKAVTKPVSSNKIPKKVNTSKTNKNKATNTKVKVVEPEPCPEPVSSKALDVLQFILDIIGFIPGLGDVCDGINALIYFARSLYLDAIISVGCIVFSLVADTILKPLKWAAGTAVDIAKKILDKLPDFPKKTISFVKSLPGKIKQIPLVRKGYDTVNDLCIKLSNYIDDLFGKALVTVNGAPPNTGKDLVQEIVGEGTEDIVRHEITNKLKKHVLNNHFLDKVLQQVKKAPIENVKNIAKNKSFFNPKWSQQKVLEATKYAYNVASVSGKKGTFFLEYAGEKIGVFVADNGTVDTVYGMYKYTFEELMKMAGR